MQNLYTFTHCVFSPPFPFCGVCTHAPVQPSLICRVHRAWGAWGDLGVDLRTACPSHAPVALPAEGHLIGLSPASLLAFLGWVRERGFGSVHGLHCSENSMVTLCLAGAEVKPGVASSASQTLRVFLVRQLSIRGPSGKG